MARAVDLGCPVLAFTVDLPMPGTRYRDVRNGLTGKLPPWETIKRGWDGASHPGWVWDVWMNGKPHVFGNIGPALPGAKSLDAFWGYIRESMDVITWKDIAWVRKHFPGKIILKGVLDVEDAREAARHGVDGIVVSNHGGRQLDGALSSISALPAIADAVGDELTVLMDGGIRSGLDVLKALASGAKACLLGRAWAYGLAGRGEAGVTHVLDIIRAELATAMALTGCTDIRKADASLLAEARTALAEAPPARKPRPMKMKEEA
jgi:L-lactate dehydrogenase (cytochrome)